MSEADTAPCRVMLMNDEQTPMEFVVHVLEEFFDMDPDIARERMFQAHREGSAECGIYPRGEAVKLVADVLSFAREHKHPLQCATEAAN
jgi:ATP-dependent Clp protease adaptor protein ClpS